MSISRKSVLAVLFTASAVTAQANCDRFYTVQPNEDCNEISAAQNVSTYQLALVNSDVINAYCSNLYPGEDLCLGIAGQDCQTTYVVQPFDTCATIATNAGIPISTLLSNNPNLNANCSNIYVGEVLCTSNQTFVYVTTSETPTPATTVSVPTTRIPTLVPTTIATSSPGIITVVSTIGIPTIISASGTTVVVVSTAETPTVTSIVVASTAETSTVTSILSTSAA